MMDLQSNGGSTASNLRHTFPPHHVQDAHMDRQEALGFNRCPSGFWCALGVGIPSGNTDASYKTCTKAGP